MSGWQSSVGRDSLLFLQVQELKASKLNRYVRFKKHPFLKLTRRVLQTSYYTNPWRRNPLSVTKSIVTLAKS